VYFARLDESKLTIWNGSDTNRPETAQMNLENLKVRKDGLPPPDPGGQLTNGWLERAGASPFLTLRSFE